MHTVHLSFALLSVFCVRFFRFFFFIFVCCSSLTRLLFSFSIDSVVAFSNGCRFTWACARKRLHSIGPFSHTQKYYYIFLAEQKYSNRLNWRIPKYTCLVVFCCCSSSLLFWHLIESMKKDKRTICCKMVNSWIPDNSWQFRISIMRLMWCSLWMPKVAFVVGCWLFFFFLQWPWYYTIIVLFGAIGCYLLIMLFVNAIRTRKFVLNKRIGICFWYSTNASSSNLFGNTPAKNIQLTNERLNDQTTEQR